MNLELVGALNELEKERGIPKEILVEAIEAAILSAYKRHYGSAENVRVLLDDRTGRMRVYALKDVVEEVKNPATEISLEEARRINANYQVGDVVEVEVTPRDFGRIAAGAAKQVVIQRIRDAERNLLYEEYANREGDIVTGVVQRMNQRNVVVDLGRIEAQLIPSEQIPGETYAPGARLKVYITEVRQMPRGPVVNISRTHPGLLKRLFELEVPEIHDGIVEIKAVAREPGSRSKIAVYSHDPNVDPVGACVGPRGARVQAVVQELRGEKIDIVEWSPDPARFVANALSPAKVVQVFLNHEEKSARAVVPDHQLSLAIGKEGQNARLAARLCGWKIDIKSESQMAELAVLEAQRAFEEAEAALRAKRAAQAAARAAQQAAEAETAPAVAETAPAAAAEKVAVEEPAPAGAEVEVLEEDLAPVEEFPEEEEREEPEELLPPEDEDLDEELEEELLEKRAAPKRRARPARRELEEELFDDVLGEDDEPLPTLFGSDDEEEDVAAGGSVSVYVAGPEESVGNPLAEKLAGVLKQVAVRPAPSQRADKDDKKRPKRVVKDLKALAELLKQEEE
ncbi:MAG: transcription termination factor NusA [Bacillota bacterium]|nr:transcription termination/antitermination protein NusA [Bacillota bacterium]